MLDAAVPHPFERNAHDQAAVLRVTLDNMDQGLIMTDPGGRVAVCNRRAIELLDLPPALMASHPRVEEVIAYQARHGEFGSLPVDLSLQMSEAGIQERTRPNGIVLEIRCVPLPEGGVVCTYTNVTERRENAEQLRMARDAAELARESAEAASRAKTDFLAAMSHEIRTPLNAIIGFADFMADSGRLEADLQRHADIIRSSGQALLTVVNDILDFSKVEAGKVVLTQASFSLPSLLENCISIARGSTLPKALTLELHVSPDLPEVLVGDEARLRQVLLNLLNNAVKFTPRGLISLTVEHERSSADRETFRFAVRDTGIGIAKDKQHRLFETFSQVDNSIGRDFGGSGLGLAICRRLVELMGGTIGVSSEADQGAEFWFIVSLPIGVLEAPSAVAKVLRTAKPGRLLLVEDVEVNAALARLVLESVGHKLDVAIDGAAAVEAVRDGPDYQLVLMDVQMQGMDGLTATRFIRALPGPRGNVPIVAMTANVLPEQIHQFQMAGMNDCIGKPFKRADLFATIDRWMSDTTAEDPSCQTKNEPEHAADPQQGFDAATFNEMVDLLSPQMVGDLLGKFEQKLCACLALMSADPKTAEIRRHVHDLVPAVSMMGLVDLSKSFIEILAFEEDRDCDGNEETFAGILRRVTPIGTQALATISAKASELQRQ